MGLLSSFLFQGLTPLGAIIMLRTNFRLILWSGLGLWAAAASAGDPWQGAQIMPKSDQVLLRSGQEITGDVYQIEWPATVERIEGQWLWISDQGAVGVPAASGWVSKSDVLKLDEAQAHYMKFLQNADAPLGALAVGDLFASRERIERRPARILEVSWINSRQRLRGFQCGGNESESAGCCHSFGGREGQLGQFREGRRGGGKPA